MRSRDRSCVVKSKFSGSLKIETSEANLDGQEAQIWKDCRTSRKIAHITSRLPCTVKVLLCSCVGTAKWLTNGSMAITRWDRGAMTILVVSKFVVEGETCLPRRV